MFLATQSTLSKFHSSFITLRYLSSSVIPTMSHHNYPNHGRFRQSPTGGDSSSLYSEQGHGRTILPPLTIAFPTSNSPGLLFNNTAAHPHLNASFDTESNTGRRTLAPLTAAFPTSDSLGLLFHDAAAHPHLNSTLFASPDKCPTIMQVTPQYSAQLQFHMSRHIVCDALVAVKCRSIDL
jgi:hypothetical protein